MSKLYGTLAGDGRSAARTRCANRQTAASAQSWEGSVTAEITIDTNGSHIARLYVRTDSGQGGRVVWQGPLSLLVNAGRLSIAGEDQRTG